MPLSPEQEKRFDDQAKLALAEFNQNVEQWSATALTLWLERWRDRAGHKRLGRIMVDHARLQGAVVEIR